MVRPFRGSDIGVRELARQIKSYNPNKIFSFDRSFRTDYGRMYSTGSMLRRDEDNSSPKANPSWALKYSPTVSDERTGKYVTISERYYVVDQANAPARMWWVNEVNEWIAWPNIDGIFIDAYGYIPSYDAVVRD